MIPYGRQDVGPDEIRAVVEVLQSDWITSGPKVTAFENAVRDYVGGGEGVAVSSGTAALHCAMHAAGIGEGDEVIVPPITFAATANAAVYLGAKPVFADVKEDTLLIDPERVEALISSRTKAIVTVDYAGQPCAYDELNDLARRNGLTLIADACHSLGGTYRGRPVGRLADLTVFSFHPVKHITTGEGGMVVTENLDFAERMRRFRNHGISIDFAERQEYGEWYYEIEEPGYNYRITDIQCALGIAQLGRLPHFLEQRRLVAARYGEFFASMPPVVPLGVASDVGHVYHLYVVRIPFQKIGKNRKQLFYFMQQNEIGVNVHYIPVHLHPFYRHRFGFEMGLCPVAETAYEEILTLPLFPSLKIDQQEHVINKLREFLAS